MKVFWWELYFCIKSWSPSSPKLFNIPDNTEHGMWKWRVGGLYTAWDWHEPTRTARWRLRAQWGVKNQKRPQSLSRYADGAPSPPRDNTEASRHRPASLPALKRWLQIKACLASQAKIYAITRHTDAPRVAWCLNNADKRRQEVFFILHLICFVV